MIIGRLLASLAGARYDVLRQTPADRFKYYATACVLLTTAAVAAVSAAFALGMAVRVPLSVAIVAGIAWGLVILNLDRLLIIGMTRQAGWTRNLLGIVPRVALAVLLGAIISTPLTLRIFEREIAVEMEHLRTERIAAFEHQLSENPRYAEIPALEAKFDAAQDLANRGVDVAVTNDPGVVQAKKRADDARAHAIKTQQAATCEIDGTCGTGVPGVAESARQKQRVAEQAAKDSAAADEEYQQAKARARAAAAGSSDSAAEDATRLRADIDARLAERKREKDIFFASAQEDGLLARIEAQSSMAERRPSLGTAQTALFLLFLSLEVLPVLMKLLQLLSPPTLYDDLISRMEEDARRESVRRASMKESADTEYAQRRLELELHQAQLQYEAGERTNHRLVDAQESIANEAIHRWADHARRASGRSLDQTYGQRDWHPRDAATATQRLNPVTVVPANPNGSNGYRPGGTRDFPVQ